MTDIDKEPSSVLQITTLCMRNMTQTPTPVLKQMACICIFREARQRLILLLNAYF